MTASSSTRMAPARGAALSRWAREHGLLLANAGLFLFSFAGMALAGVRAYSSEQVAHGQAAVSLWAYLRTGDFVEALFENWESEFLQMGVYVLFTAYLFQQGSPESKPLDERTPQDVDPRRQRYRHRPWPVRRGGVWLRLYSHSLATALFALFLLSFGLHALGGTTAYNEDASEHGEPTASVFQFVTTSEFWYQSFQNWQSEFLSVGTLAVLGIFLRQRGSPESKPVAAPSWKTGA
jgi:hypothetical protein